MKQAIVILSLLALLRTGYAQFSAGPDKFICSGTGTFLGLPGQMIPDSWCVHWMPEESLDDPTSIRPKATPENTTIYTVQVLTDDWQSIITDQVTVTVEFGGIKFTPPFLKQGSMDSVQSVVTVNPNNDEVTWSIHGESLGCQINPMTGVIHPGDQYGTITIRATKTEDTECFADKKIDINEGVKDVTARDFSHSGRIAKDGVDTLYLVGEGAALITAIPNASGFNAGSPEWHDDGNGSTIVPADGETEILDDNPGEVDTRYVAGSGPDFEPNVNVIRLNSDELVIDLTPLTQKLQDFLKKGNDFIKSKLEKSGAPLPNLTVEVSIASFKYKKSKAEKYNDPGWDYKYVVEAGGSIKLTGKIYHPQFTYIWDFQDLIGLTAGSELYLEPYFEFGLTGSVVKDPSKEYQGWTVLSNPIKFTVTGGLRGVFNIVATGGGYSVEGGFNLATEISGDLLFYLTTGELKAKFTIAPLQGNTKVIVERFVDPKKKYTFFDYTVDLLDKWSSPEFELFDFGQDQ